MSKGPPHLTKTDVCDEAAQVLNHYVRRPSRKYLQDNSGDAGEDSVKVVHSIEHRHPLFTSQKSNCSHGDVTSSVTSDEVKVQTIVHFPGAHAREKGEVVLVGENYGPVLLDMEPYPLHPQTTCDENSNQEVRLQQLPHVSKVLVDHHVIPGTAEHVTSISMLEHSSHTSGNATPAEENAWIDTTVFHRPQGDVVEVNRRNIHRHNSSHSDNFIATNSRIDFWDVATKPSDGGDTSLDLDALVAQYGRGQKPTLSGSVFSSTPAGMKKASSSGHTDRIFVTSPAQLSSNPATADLTQTTARRKLSPKRNSRSQNFMQKFTPWWKEKKKPKSYRDVERDLPESTGRFLSISSPRSGFQDSSLPRRARLQRMSSEEQTVSVFSAAESLSHQVGPTVTAASSSASDKPCSLSSMSSGGGAVMLEAPLASFSGSHPEEEDVDIVVHKMQPTQRLRKQHTLPTSLTSRSKTSSLLSTPQHPQHDGPGGSRGFSQDLHSTVSPELEESGDELAAPHPSGGRVQKKKKKSVFKFFEGMWRSRQLKGPATGGKSSSRVKLVQSVMGQPVLPIGATRTPTGPSGSVSSEKRNSLVINDFTHMMESEAKRATSRSASKRRPNMKLDLLTVGPGEMLTSQPTPSSSGSSTQSIDYKHKTVAAYLARVADGLMNPKLAHSQKHQSLLQEALQKMEPGRHSVAGSVGNKNEGRRDSSELEPSTTHASELSLATTLMAGTDGSRPSSGISASPLARRDSQDVDRPPTTRQRSDTAPSIQPFTPKHRDDRDTTTIIQNTSTRERHKSESATGPQPPQSPQMNPSLMSQATAEEPNFTRKMRSKGRLYKNRLDVEIPALVLRLHNDPTAADYSVFEQHLLPILQAQTDFVGGDSRPQHSWREVSLLYYITRKLIRHELALSLSSSGEDNSASLASPGGISSGHAATGWSATTVSVSLGRAQVGNIVRDSGVEVSPLVSRPWAESSVDFSEPLTAHSHFAGLAKADMWRDFCIQYFAQHLSEWVSQQGGFQAFLDITTDSELD